MLDFMDGAKTFIGGAALIAAGGVGMAFGLVDPLTGITLIGNGFGIWGIGRKLEKLTEAQKPIDLKELKGDEKAH